LDAVQQVRVRIYWYWPKLDASTPHVGYGRSASYPWLRVLGFAWSVCTNLYFLFIDPTIKPRIRGIVRYGLLMFASIAIGSLGRRADRLSGYYELDANGVPVRFLAQRFPNSIKGRFGVRREAFLRKTRSAQ
jgi:hypothetical protein